MLTEEQENYMNYSLQQIVVVNNVETTDHSNKK